MVDESVRPSGSPEVSVPAARHREIRARRIPKPAACGCGSMVAFDVEKHEFFCIGCGAARACTCRRSLLTATVPPINVAKPTLLRRPFLTYLWRTDDAAPAGTRWQTKRLESS